MLEIIGLLFLLVVLGIIMIPIAIFNSVTSAKKQREKLREEEVTAQEKAAMISFFAPWLKPLHDYYSEQNGSFKDAVCLLGHDSPENLLLSDLIQLIIGIVLPNDEIRTSDVDLLRAATWLFELKSIEKWGPSEFRQMIERVRRSADENNVHECALTDALADMKSPDLPRAIMIYTHLATKIATYPEYATKNRSEGVVKTLEGFQELIKHWRFERELDNQNQEDNRYAVLKAEPGCSLEDLKLAYRREASLWHPDKLAHLAPELREHAERQMTIINKAYQSLCEEYGDAV